MTYVIPNANRADFEEIIFELNQNPDKYKDMLFEILKADDTLYDYINRTYIYEDKDKKAIETKEIREKNLCAIVYHVLKRGLRYGEKLPPVDEDIAFGLEITKVEDPETMDDYVEEINDYDPEMYRIILNLSVRGETQTERQQLYRSTGFVYIALMESLDAVILNETIKTTPPYPKDRLEPYVECIEKRLDFTGL